MAQPDVLMLDRIGGAYTHASLTTGGLGGSEIELLQVAHGLTAKGHSVVVANGVESVCVEDGVTYVPHAQAWQHRPTKALYLQRYSTPETRLEIPSEVRIVVRANDVYCPPYDVHKGLLSSGRAALVTNTKWQAGLFGFAKESVVIPPMLEPMPKVKKQKGLFVFASGAMKGFEETVALWCELKARHPAMRQSLLRIVAPGWGEPRPLTTQEMAAEIRYIGCPTPTDYRRWIAKAEGLFMVLTMPETFCCAAALAERAATRTHILCKAGLGGLPEAVRDDYWITENAEEFETKFCEILPPHSPYFNAGEDSYRDLRPDTLIDRWADVLHVDKPTIPVSPFPDDPSLAPNQEPLGPFFGDFLSLLRSSIAPGGSEFGAGLMLFSLAASIQARHIVEIGRFKGFSTLALAAACKLQHIGWKEPKAAEQRPDVDYNRSPAKPWFYAPAAGWTMTPPWIMANTPPSSSEAVKKEWTEPTSWPSYQHVVSIDPASRPEAMDLLVRANLQNYVDFKNQRSDEITIYQPIDLLFVDGDHSVTGLRADLQRFLPWVRPGGYFILHDYFGWFTDGRNGSPIAKVIAEDLTGCDRVLIDTQYASLVIFRKSQNLTERWELEPKPQRLPARADGRPTVGLCIIAKGDEASTVATRAIVSGKKAGVDCVTVVCDANDATADVARSLGADVFIRPTPQIDWTRGNGVIAGARNDALAIAEQRTDYVLALDADDYLEGTLPTVLDHDAYEVTIQDGGVQYTRLQLFRSSLGWRYRGIIHEVLEMTGGGPVGHLSDLIYRRGKSSYGYQDQDPPAVKYSKHAHLAEKWLHDHPDDTRMAFYLARSYHDAGRLDEAIRAYEQRIAMRGGWEEERSYASYQIGRILMEQGKDPTTALLRAHEIGVLKAEPFVALARWYRDDARKQFSTAYAFAVRAAAIPQPSGGLFLEPWVYRFEAAAEVAICAYWLGQKQEALERFEALLPKVPAERRKWAEEMVALCVRETAR